MPAPNPEDGEAEDNCVEHSLGALLKAEQIVASKLAESLPAEIFCPLITRVGDPPTPYLSTSDLLTLKVGKFPFHVLLSPKFSVTLN